MLKKYCETNLCRLALCCVLILSAQLFAPICALAQGGGRVAGGDMPFPVEARYHKAEVSIPMRDGAKLFTAIYSPKDGTRTDGKAAHHPIILMRTPYGIRPYGENSYPAARGTMLKFMEAGYIVVNQDVRGRFMSDGHFVDVRPVDAAERGAGATDESTDTYDTIDYLVKNVPDNNGKVGIWGISYPGYYAAAGGVNSHPALKAISPQAPVSDWFIGDDDHHNGALFLMDCFSFLCFFGPDRDAPTTESRPFVAYNPTDAYKFYLDLGPLKNINARYFHDKIAYWNDVTRHPNYDAFWQARALPAHLKGVKCAVLTVGGWYDAEDLYGPFAVFHNIARFNPQTPNSLVIGPWPHGGWGSGDFDKFGAEEFGQKTGEYYRNNILMPFFNHYLLDSHDKLDSADNAKTDNRAKPLVQTLPARATVFETGDNRWRSFNQWPPRSRPLALIMQPDHRLVELGSSSAAGVAGGSEYEEWVSDPANPVPYIGEVRGGRKNEYMNDDQRFAMARPDVLYFQTEPLKKDVTIAGPIRADLKVSTTGTDADFITKVIDVYPADAPEAGMANYHKQVRAEVMRARYRDSYSAPKALTPGKVTRVAYELRDVCHTFKKGHRIMVQVQSSWFPLVDRNPQTFVDIYHADESDFKKATHRLYHSASDVSQVILPRLQ